MLDAGGFLQSLTVFLIFSVIDLVPSLNPFTVFNGADASLPRSYDEVPRFGPLNRRGILLAGPPLEYDDCSDSLSLTYSHFDWQLKFDLEPTLTLLNNMPFRELCLFRFSFGLDFSIYCRKR